MPIIEDYSFISKRHREILGNPPEPYHAPDITKRCEKCGAKIKECQCDEPACGCGVKGCIGGCCI